MDDPLDAMLQGKEPIRPVLTRLLSVLEELGTDVDAEQAGAGVVFRRGREFALVEPATATRVDVGLVLPGAAETDRLRPAGSQGLVTHRVSLAHEDEIDGELTEWLRAAYDGAAT